MKTILLGTIVLLPCLLIFNDSEYVIVNLLGLAYIGMLVLSAKFSVRVSRFFKDLDETMEYYNEQIFKA